MRTATRSSRGAAAVVAGLALLAGARTAAAQDAAGAQLVAGQKMSDDIALATLSLEVRWWWFNLDGGTKLTDQDPSGATLEGSVMKWGEEYELDTQNAAPELVAELKVGGKGWGAVASYMEMGSDGSQFLTESFEYDGQQYAVGDFVSQALDLRYGAILARWMLVENLFGLHVGPTLGIGYVRFDQIVERTSGSPPVTEQVHETGRSPLPLIGASARWSIMGTAILKADVAGGYAAYDGNRGAWFDATLGIYYVYKAVLGIGGGIRFLHIDIEKLELEEDVSWASGRFTLYGAYIALEVRL